MSVRETDFLPQASPFATFLLPFSVTKYEKEKVFGINDLFSGLKLGDN